MTSKMVPPIKKKEIKPKYSVYEENKEDKPDRGEKEEEEKKEFFEKSVKNTSAVEKKIVKEIKKRIPDIPEKKICNKCLTECNPVDDFYPSNQNVCKICLLSLNKIYKRAKKEEFNGIIRKLPSQMDQINYKISLLEKKYKLLIKLFKSSKILREEFEISEDEYEDEE